MLRRRNCLDWIYLPEELEFPLWSFSRFFMCCYPGAGMASFGVHLEFHWEVYMLFPFGIMQAGRFGVLLFIDFAF